MPVRHPHLARRAQRRPIARRGRARRCGDARPAAAGGRKLRRPVTKAPRGKASDPDADRGPASGQRSVNFRMGAGQGAAQGEPDGCPVNPVGGRSVGAVGDRRVRKPQRRGRPRESADRGRRRGRRPTASKSSSKFEFRPDNRAARYAAARAAPFAFTDFLYLTAISGRQEIHP